MPTAGKLPGTRPRRTNVRRTCEPAWTASPLVGRCQITSYTSCLYLLDLLSFSLRATGALRFSIDWRAVIAFGRRVAIGLTGSGGATKVAFCPSDNPSWPRPEAKQGHGNDIITRCASNEMRAASQGDMNQGNIVIFLSELSNAL